MKKLLFLILALMSLLLAVGMALAADGGEATFFNPIAYTGSDPFLTYDKEDQCYYYCYTTYNSVRVAKVDDPTVLRRNLTRSKQVYIGVMGSELTKEFWAPELLKIDGTWYIYFTASSDITNTHKMFLLRCTGDKPTDQFELVGEVDTGFCNWSIDGTMFEYGGERYFVWASYGPLASGIALYMAHMDSLTSIDTEPILLSSATQDWEQKAALVNEGPQPLFKGDTLHIAFSANDGNTDHYCLGLLTYRPEQGDILDPNAWIESDGPVFSSVDGSTGPGHNSFTTSPDGTEDYIVYHANIVSGTGFSGRSVRMQKFTWDGDMPVFGEPARPYEALPIPSGLVVD
ncbi:MAG: hypothetical protein E7333_00560 [Clostridiales bacterium]|nr:hypothetical protein [Clostridiales bacterium]